VAAKSYKRALIGTLCKLLGTIPVERAQDIAKFGKGHIISIANNIIIVNTLNYYKYPLILFMNFFFSSLIY
jgi:hypothetical protein